jgi:hypothetical protein
MPEMSLWLVLSILIIKDELITHLGQWSAPFGVEHEAGAQAKQAARVVPSAAAATIASLALVQVDDMHVFVFAHQLRCAAHPSAVKDTQSVGTLLR